MSNVSAMFQQCFRLKRLRGKAYSYIETLKHIFSIEVYFIGYRVKKTYTPMIMHLFARVTRTRARLLPSQAGDSDA